MVCISGLHFPGCSLLCRGFLLRAPPTPCCYRRGLVTINIVIRLSKCPIPFSFSAFPSADAIHCFPSLGPFPHLLRVSVGFALGSSLLDCPSRGLPSHIWLQVSPACCQYLHFLFHPDSFPRVGFKLPVSTLSQKKFEGILARLKFLMYPLHKVLPCVPSLHK